MQSGKPVGVFRTHADAPRVLIANSNLVPKWATWEHFNELDRKGLMMYGQMTAGSLDLHRQPGHRAGHLRDLRRSRPPALRRRPRRAAGSSPPASAAWAARSRWRRRFAGACSLNIECQQIAHRLPPAHAATSTSRRRTSTTRWRCIAAVTPRARRPCRSACSATPPRSLPELVRRAKAGGIRPDLVTDQTSAHDLVNGYLPAGWSVERNGRPRRPTRRSTPRCARPRRESCAAHVQAMLDFQAMGMPTVDYGNNIRQVAFDDGVKNAFDFPASCRPTSGRCSAAARARSAGWRCRATRRTSARPTPR